MSNSNFTYERLDNDEFFNMVLKYLKFNDEIEIINLIKGGKCVIEYTGDFTRRRWNEYIAYVYFYIPFDKLILANEEIEKKLYYICDRIMPKDVGYDIYGVKFSTLLSKESEKTLIEDLEDNIQNLSPELITQILPDDIKQKGIDMAKAYLYLYYIENSLRLFIEKVGKDKWGENYFNSFNINNDIKNNIKGRKKHDEKNKWLSLRGDSDIFYLDFNDLGSIIQNNWELFKLYFPDQDFIIPKIKELGKIRNLIAHNSFIQNDERFLIKTYYNSILKQLNNTF